MPAPLFSLRILAAALMGSVVFFALALWFVLGADTGTTVPGEPTGTSTPPAWGLLAPLAIGVLCHLLVTAIGYRFAAVEPTTPTDQAVGRGEAQFRSAMMVRFVLSEVPVIASMALAFLVDGGGYVVFLVGGATTLALAAWHVWPRDAQITRAQERLESAGARVPLHEALHGRAATY